MTTLRSDVLVLGSSVGGLVAGTYLARAGLRVVVVEEQAHVKRPPLLREPFLLSGLEAGGRIQRVLRELGVPLIDQRELRLEDPPLQLLLPGARIDLHRDSAAMADELEAQGLAERGAAVRWLDAVDVAAGRARAELWEDPPPPRGRAGTLGGARSHARAPRISAPARIDVAMPAPPGRTGRVLEGVVAGLAGLDDPRAAPAAPLLVQVAREGGFRMPHSGAPFTELLRRRLLSLHGEIWDVEDFALADDPNEPGIELVRDALFGRSLLVAAPREPLRRWLGRSASGPGWLRAGVPARVHASVLFRVERSRSPVGLASRALAIGPDSALHRIARSPEPDHDGIEWMVLSGPGAVELPAQAPLGELAPFPGDGFVAVDPGPAPEWDLDAHDLAFGSAVPPAPLRHRAPIGSVGPELALGLGFEGEVLQARRAALRLAHRLGARRAL